MTSITYIRHAEKQYNKILDSPIYKDPLPTVIVYDTIISSPYLRCRQTAEALNSLIDKDILIDVRVSQFLGENSSRSGEMHPTSLYYGDIPVENDYAQFDERLDEHIEYIKTLRGNILIVTHGGVVRRMQEKLAGSSFYARENSVPFLSGFHIIL